MSQQKLIRYLLGELSKDEQAEIETQYLEENGYFEQLLDVEDELIHQYVMGALAGRGRELFERHFLAIPQNREKVKRAQALKAYLAPAPPMEEPVAIRPPNRIAWWLNAVADFLTPKQTGLRLAYALAMAAMIFFTTTLFLKTNKFDTQIAQFESEHQLFSQKERIWRQQVETERRQRDELTTQFENEQNRRVELEKELTQQQRPKRDMFAITLKPGVSRGAQNANKLNLAQIKQQTQLLKIQFQLEDPQVYESYRAFLITAGEDTVLIKYGLKAQQTDKGKMLVWQLATSDLSDEDYLITVQGVTTSREIVFIGSHPLLLERK